MGKTTEIELKAHIDNSIDFIKRLTILAGEGLAFSKDDAYWFTVDTQSAVSQAGESEGKPANSPVSGLPVSGLRIRREKAGENEHTWVTWKDKEKRDGIEVNDEHEFEVTSGADFEELLVRLGLEKRIYKRKQGLSWQYQGITAELCEVSGSGNPQGSEHSGGPKNLGWFLELEILTKDDTTETVTAARERLLSLLEQLGVGKENIESRYYSEMLSR